VVLSMSEVVIACFPASGVFCLSGTVGPSKQFHNEDCHHIFCYVCCHINLKLLPHSDLEVLNIGSAVRHKMYYISSLKYVDVLVD